jgi:hypothetical protein
MVKNKEHAVLLPKTIKKKEIMKNEHKKRAALLSSPFCRFIRILFYKRIVLIHNPHTA